MKANQLYELLKIDQNQPAIITSEPITETPVYRLYHYDLSATNPDNDFLIYRLIEKPPTMRINILTGRIRWRPRSNDIGDHPVIAQVTDGRHKVT